MKPMMAQAGQQAAVLTEVFDLYAAVFQAAEREAWGWALALNSIRRTCCA